MSVLTTTLQDVPQHRVWGGAGFYKLMSNSPRRHGVLKGLDKRLYLMLPGCQQESLLLLFKVLVGKGNVANTRSQLCEDVMHGRLVSLNVQGLNSLEDPIRDDIGGWRSAHTRTRSVLRVRLIVGVLLGIHVRHGVVEGEGGLESGRHVVVVEDHNNWNW